MAQKSITNEDETGLSEALSRLESVISNVSREFITGINKEDFKVLKGLNRYYVWEPPEKIQGSDDLYVSSNGVSSYILRRERNNKMIPIAYMNGFMNKIYLDIDFLESAGKELIRKAIKESWILKTNYESTE